MVGENESGRRGGAAGRTGDRTGVERDERRNKAGEDCPERNEAEQTAG